MEYLDVSRAFHPILLRLPCGRGGWSGGPDAGRTLSSTTALSQDSTLNFAKQGVLPRRGTPGSWLQQILNRHYLTLSTYPLNSTWGSLLDHRSHARHMADTDGHYLGIRSYVYRETCLLYCLSTTYISRNSLLPMLHGASASSYPFNSVVLPDQPNNHPHPSLLYG